MTNEIVRIAQIRERLDKQDWTGQMAILCLQIEDLIEEVKNHKYICDDKFVRKSTVKVALACISCFVAGNAGVSLWAMVKLLGWIK